MKIVLCSSQRVKVNIHGQWRAHKRVRKRSPHSAVWSYRMCDRKRRKESNKQPNWCSVVCGYRLLQPIRFFCRSLRTDQRITVEKNEKKMFQSWFCLRSNRLCRTSRCQRTICFHLFGRFLCKVFVLFLLLIWRVWVRAFFAEYGNKIIFSGQRFTSLSCAHMLLLVNEWIVYFYWSVWFAVVVATEFMIFVRVKNNIFLVTIIRKREKYW